MVNEEQLLQEQVPVATEPVPLPAVADPTANQERISSVDVLRGVSLFGILLMNILSFGLIGGAYDNPKVFGGHTGVNFWTWATVAVLFEGKMRAIFSMLFGAGLVLMTSRADAKGNTAIADVWLRRCLWMMLFGLLHAYLLWDGDILFPYALTGLMLYPFRKMPVRGLVVGGILLLLWSAPRNWWEHIDTQALKADAELAKFLEEKDKNKKPTPPVIPAAQDLSRRDVCMAPLCGPWKAPDDKTFLPMTSHLSGAKTQWEERTKNHIPTGVELEKRLLDKRRGYWDIVKKRAGELRQWHAQAYYGFEFFDVGGMMLIGMALLKLGVLTAERSTRFYLLMMLIGYGIGIPVRGAAAWYQAKYDFEIMIMSSSYITYDISRLTVAAGHAGLVMLIVKLGAVKWLTRRLAAVGQMAFSNYITHTIVCTTFFYGYGLGYFGKLERHQLYYVVFSLWLFQLILSPIWLRNFRFGPLEWLWRSLTYWKRQPFRIAA